MPEKRECFIPGHQIRACQGSQLALIDTFILNEDIGAVGTTTEVRTEPVTGGPQTTSYGVHGLMFDWSITDDTHKGGKRDAQAQGRNPRGVAGGPR